MSDCLQYQEKGASRTKKENLSIIHQARNRLYTVDQEGAPYYPRGRNQKQGGSMAWPRLLTKENLEQWHQSGFLTGETFLTI